MLQRGLQPPPHIQHHPDGVGVRFHRLDEQVPRHAVEELLDVQLDHPVPLPAALAGILHRVQRRPSGPVSEGVRVEDGLHPSHQMPGHHGLRHAVGDSGNASILVPPPCGLGISTARTGGGK